MQIRKLGGTARNSSIELLRIIAMIFIVISHAMPDGDITVYESALNIGCATVDW